MKYPKRSQYKHAKQKKYRVRNWAEYNKALRCRGDLTIWFAEEAIANIENKLSALDREGTDPVNLPRPDDLLLMEID